MMKKSLLSVVKGALLGLLALAATASQAGLILAFSGGNLGQEAFAPGSTRGWSFSVTSTTIADGLAIWDWTPNGLGLVQDHLVRLWDSSGNLLASQAITNANSTPSASINAAGRWLVTSISPLSLTLGPYVLGADYVVDSPDYFGLAATSTVIEAGFAFLQSGFALGYGFPATTNSSFDPGLFGPNLRVVASVPEPATLALFGLGLAGLGALRRKKLAA